MHEGMGEQTSILWPGGKDKKKPPRYICGRGPLIRKKERLWKIPLPPSLRFKDVADRFSNLEEVSIPEAGRDQ